MASLLFIDTNIYLDFYRVRGSGTSLSMLKHFDANHDRIITTTEVEMEYKKNRQVVILQSLNLIKPVDFSNIVVPDFLKETQLNKSLKQSQKQHNEKIRKLRDRTSKLLDNPEYYDPVYKVLQRLFKAKEHCNLYRTRDPELRKTIRNLAQKRFTLGYPPKKDRDLSINDAINWEWIIYCAKNSNSDIVIVSRDLDYGIVSNDNAILNDWLQQEFKERVSRKRNISLTNRLAEGFKRASITVSKLEEQEEEQHIRDTWRTIWKYTIPSDLAITPSISGSVQYIDPNLLGINPAVSLQYVDPNLLGINPAVSLQYVDPNLLGINPDLFGVDPTISADENKTDELNNDLTEEQSSTELDNEKES